MFFFLEDKKQIYLFKSGTIKLSGAGVIIKHHELRRYKMKSLKWVKNTPSGSKDKKKMLFATTEL